MFKHCLNNGFDDFTRRFSVDSPRKSGSWMMTSHICVWTFWAPPNPYHQLPDEMPSENGLKTHFQSHETRHPRLPANSWVQLWDKGWFFGWFLVVKFNRPIFGGKVAAVMSPLEWGLEAFFMVWWVDFLFGYGSIPITIFSGMNIHLPAILMFTRGTRFWHTAI